MLEELIAYHCAPALVGIKASNIVTYNNKKYPNAKSQIKMLNLLLNQRDIYIEVICECERSTILIVYKKTKLLAQLNDRQVNLFLSEFGYANCENLDDYLNILRKRMKQEQFPHEIGVFLGYPVQDVYSFINHKDEGCIYVGAWKAYSNIEYAKNMFLRYKRCRAALIKRINEGKSLVDIFCVA